MPVVNLKSSGLDSKLMVELPDETSEFECMAVHGGGDVWINDSRFRIVRQLGEGGFAYVYLVKEVVSDSSSALASGLAKKVKEPSHPSDNEQMDLVREEIRVSTLFSHPNPLPLLDHAIISVKPTQEGSWNHEAYLLFPVQLDGTLLYNSTATTARKEFFICLRCSSNISAVFSIFGFIDVTTCKEWLEAFDWTKLFQQLCAGHMHNFEPPYAHNDVKPGNILLSHRKGKRPLAVLMDFGSAPPATKQIRSRSEALQLQDLALADDMTSDRKVWRLKIRVVE
ncbi:PHOTOPERIOD-INDEPENDENT EARLY FLOWERING 1 family protein [Hibiscus syriacus]|uniref:non-specific serine/threonine protein kinase n=1 Tax=Hibiscus syriacus TaxID=106335 RepID=A0A6A2XFA8_HIBSY|nr:PHOTOPERIOD-INDEPENDENT EARLY FLOWERING 1 family protein [Hibiscus syriacus]